MTEMRADIPHLATHQVLRRGGFAVQFFQLEIDCLDHIAFDDVQAARDLLNPEREDELIHEGLLTLPASQMVVETGTVYEVSPVSACGILKRASQALSTIPTYQTAPSAEFDHALDVMNCLQARMISTALLADQ